MTDKELEYVPSLDEIVFEHRNKEYGAYDLRSKYRRFVTRAFVLGTSLFVLGIVAPFLYMKFKQLTEKKTEVKVDLVNILDEEKPKEELKEDTPPPPPPKVEEKVEIVQNVVPEPVKAPKVETPPPPIKVQLETQTGLVNQEGVKQAAYAPPPVAAKSNAVESKPSTTEIYDSVDQDAEFPGGLNSFRGKFTDSFDTSAMEGGEGTIKATVSFIVEINGAISDVNVKGPNSDFNREAERTVRSIRSKWAPAKINGQPVRQRYKLPVTMNFE